MYNMDSATIKTEILRHFANWETSILITHLSATEVAIPENVYTVVKTPGYVHGRYRPSASVTGEPLAEPLDLDGNVDQNMTVPWTASLLPGPNDNVWCTCLQNLGGPQRKLNVSDYVKMMRERGIILFLGDGNCDLSLACLQNPWEDADEEDESWGPR